MISGAILFNTYNQTGEVIRRDVSLKGGISVTINSPYDDTSGLEEFLFNKFIISLLCSAFPHPFQSNITSLICSFVFCSAWFLFWF